MAAAYGFDAWYYDRDPDWKDFHRMNRLVSEFVDYSRVNYTPETAPVIKAVGWLPIDYLMLENWAFLDRDRFNVQTLQAVLDGIPRALTNRCGRCSNCSSGWPRMANLLGLLAPRLCPAGLATL